MPTSALGEFIGTALLILLGNGVVANVVLSETKGHGSGWIVITTGWALAVLSGVLVALSLGAPGELNPAVSVANVIFGTRTMPDAVWHIGAQFAGAIVGQTVVWLTYLPHWALTRDPAAILGCHCNAPAVRATVPNLITEIVGTMVLVIVASAVGTRAVAGTTPATNLGPIFVGGLVWAIGLSLGGPTGYAINPARDLGPRIAHAILPIANKGGNDWGYAWIPVVGPLVGGVLAALLWKAVAPV
jgi:glycerol uptake facilitator protein